MASKNAENIEENVPNKSETVKGNEGKGKTKWSNSEIKKLIEEYEEKPCLWHVFTEDYHNIEKTSKAQEELSVCTHKLEDICLVYLSDQFIYSLVNVFLTFSIEIYSDSYGIFESQFWSKVNEYKPVEIRAKNR